MEAFIASLDPWLIYLVVAVLTFGESAAFLSLVFPGEVALVAAAALGLVGARDTAVASVLKVDVVVERTGVRLWFGARPAGGRHRRPTLLRESIPDS